MSGWRASPPPESYDERVLAAFGAPADFSPTQADKPDEDKTAGEW
jgi:hypothetical protein